MNVQYWNVLAKVSQSGDWILANTLTKLDLKSRVKYLSAALRDAHPPVVEHRFTEEYERLAADAFILARVEFLFGAIDDLYLMSKDIWLLKGDHTHSCRIQGEDGDQSEYLAQKDLAFKRRARVAMGLWPVLGVYDTVNYETPQMR